MGRIRRVSCNFNQPEGTVTNRTLTLATGTLIVGLAVGCSSARGDERVNGDGTSGSGDEVTVSGCLTASDDGRFALTAAPDAAVAAAARAMDDERNTSTYVLIGGDNMQAHLGKRVEVTGTLTGKTQDVEHHDTKKTEGTPATDGRDTPVVKTKEEIDMQVRQLNVRQVRDVAPSCTVNP